MKSDLGAQHTVAAAFVKSNERQLANLFLSYFLVGGKKKTKNKNR